MNLNQVTLPSLDIKASIDFYAGMGFRQIVDSPEYARFECPEGEATFSIHKTERTVPDTGVVIYFESARLDQLVGQLKRDGYEFDGELTDESWLWREARLRDPSDNQICIYFAGTNRKNPPWRIEND